MVKTSVTRPVRHAVPGLIVVAAAAFACPQSKAAPGVLGVTATKRTTSEPAVDPIVMALFDQMGTYLRSLPYFRVSAQTSTDFMADNGQKLQSTGLVQIFARKPDRLRIDIASDALERQLFYDGSTFTEFGPESGYYAQFRAPNTIAEVIDALEKRYGIELPLANLFQWGTEKFDTRQIRSAVDIGPSKVAGTECRHFAFRQRDVDWQVWVAQGRRPVPLKIVHTNTSVRAQPQHVAVLTWELDTRPPDSVFQFIAPTGSRRIEFDTVR